MPSSLDLEKILDEVILAEGSAYTNHPNDRGGPTKYGITLATLKSIPLYEDATENTVKNLTLEIARNVYKNIYAYQFLFIADPIVFKFIFNGAVQHGTGGMIKVVQKALGLTADGVLGPVTKAALISAQKDTPKFLSKLIAARCNYYANILMRDSSQRVFAAGWLNRIAKDLT